jgi:hypothetical protein
MLIDCRSGGLLTVDNHARRWTSKDIRSRCRRMSLGQYHATTAIMMGIGRLITFDMLPNDVLLEMYDFYVDKDFEPSEEQL